MVIIMIIIISITTVVTTDRVMAMLDTMMNIAITTGITVDIIINALMLTTTNMAVTVLATIINQARKLNGSMSIRSSFVKPTSNG